MGQRLGQRQARRPSPVMRAPPQWSQGVLPGSAPRIEGTPEPFPETPAPRHGRLFYWLGMLGTAAAGAVYLSH
jgi:hypothetical protein